MQTPRHRPSPGLGARILPSPEYAAGDPQGVPCVEAADARLHAQPRMNELQPQTRTSVTVCMDEHGSDNALVHPFFLSRGRKRMEYETVLHKRPCRRRFGLNVLVSRERYHTMTTVDGLTAPCVITKRMHVALEDKGVIQAGDRILSYNDKPTWGSRDLRAKRIKLRLRRGDVFALDAWAQEVREKRDVVRRARRDRCRDGPKRWVAAPLRRLLDASARLRAARASKPPPSCTRARASARRGSGRGWQRTGASGRGGAFAGASR